MTQLSRVRAALLAACAVSLIAVAGCTPLESVTGGVESPVALPQQTPEIIGPQPCDVATERGVGEAIGAQIDALRAGDFDAAYLFAAPDFRAGVPLAAFEGIIRQGFPSLLEASSFSLSGCIVDPRQALAETTVTVRTTSQEVTTLRYVVTELPEGWRILAAQPVAAVSQGS